MPLAYSKAIPSGLIISGSTEVVSEVATKKNPEDREHRDYWSEDGQIFFCDGVGFGVTGDLRTIPLGYEDDILEAFKTGKLADYLNPMQRQVLAGILEYRQEEGYGDSRLGEGNMERAADNGLIRRKPSTVRQSSLKARTSVRQTRPKIKSLSK